MVLGASTSEDIEAARAQLAQDSYLVQQHIDPADISGDPAWFRVLYCLGDVHPCFWHPQTFHYKELSPEQRRTPWGLEIERITALTARVSGMSLFSTELALTAEGKLVVVDYVNDMCDLRKASDTADGVPDRVVEALAARVAARAGRGPGR